jgi:hypothetical protein
VGQPPIQALHVFRALTAVSISWSSMCPRSVTTTANLKATLHQVISVLAEMVPAQDTQDYFNVEM